MYWEEKRCGHMQIPLWVRIWITIALKVGAVLTLDAASCDKCNHGRAYYHQLQIRSADEPMTTCE